MDGEDIFKFAIGMILWFAGVIFLIDPLKNYLNSFLSAIHVPSVYFPPIQICLGLSLLVVSGIILKKIK